VIQSRRKTRTKYGNQFTGLFSTGVVQKLEGMSKRREKVKYILEVLHFLIKGQ
jgi:hypothetical protein